MHAITALRFLAVSSLALALFGKVEGHARFEKRRPKPSVTQSRVDLVNGIPESAVVLYPSTGLHGDFGAWFPKFQGYPGLKVSLMKFDSSQKFDISTYPDYCISIVKADAIEAAKNASVTPYVMIGSGLMASWDVTDGILLVTCQVFTVNVQSPSNPTLDSGDIKAYPDRVGEVVQRIAKDKFNVSILTTGTDLDAVLQEGSKKVKLSNGSPIIPVSPKNNEKVIEKGHKQDAKKGDELDSKFSDGDDAKTDDGGDAQKVNASHKHKKASKHS